MEEIPECNSSTDLNLPQQQLCKQTYLCMCIYTHTVLLIQLDIFPWIVTFTSVEHKSSHLVKQKTKQTKQKLKNKKQTKKHKLQSC